MREKGAGGGGGGAMRVQEEGGGRIEGIMHSSFNLATEQ